MAETRQFTRAEVAAADKKQTLFIIDNYVYDVSVFLDEHPGGHEVLQNVHGRDASEDFDDVGHSLDAKELMVKYRVGQLVQAERSEPRARAADWSSSPANTEEPAPLLSSWQVALLGGLLATLVYLYLY